MKNNQVLFSIMDKTIKGLFFILFFFTPLLANAQVSISGKVADTKGDALIGVNVAIKKERVQPSGQPKNRRREKPS
jgi:hypothetical protein